MVILDVAIVNVALPTIQVDLDFSRQNLQWVVSAYALAFGDLAMFAPEIVGQIALNDALWFAGLWLGWQVLARIPTLAAWQAR